MELILDDKPIFEDERFYCLAFKEGGIEKEQEARIEWRRQKQQEHYENRREDGGSVIDGEYEVKDDQDKKS